LIALVIPEQVNAVVADPVDGSSIFGECNTLRHDPAWEGRSVCVVVVPNGPDVVMQPMRWDAAAKKDVPSGDTVTVRVQDRRLILLGPD
jgi:hypothetical protein